MIISVHDDLPRPALTLDGECLAAHVNFNTNIPQQRRKGECASSETSMRAVMQHNLSWLNHFIWGDPLPDFTAPELPKRDEKKAREEYARWRECSLVACNALT